jgi:hypothetical protein
MDESHTIAVHRFLLRASLALGGIFVWVLIFHALYASGETLSGAMLLTTLSYVFLQLCIFFMTPLAAGNAPHGITRAMILASLAQSAAFLWLAASATGVFGPAPLNLWWGIVGFVILSALYRTFYWVPYSALNIPVRGSWSPRPKLLLEVFLALMPVVAAIFIIGGEGGTWFVLIVAAILAFFAALSLVRLPDSYERFEWGYAETIRVLFSKENREVYVSSLLDGMQGAALLFLWPIAIFLLFDWSYFTLGTMLSITLLLILLLRKNLQRLFRSWAVHDNHRFLAGITGSAWILRLIIVSPITIVIADTLHHIGISPRRTGMDLITQEQAADSAHYIDEYTALKEMGNSLGRVITCLVLLISMMVIPPLASLGIAFMAVAASSIIALYRDAEHDAL